MDSEDIRVTGGDMANASMSSAASIGSSCSSAGIGDGDNAQSKQFTFNGKLFDFFFNTFSPARTWYIKIHFHRAFDDDDKSFDVVDEHGSVFDFVFVGHVQ